jgi:hypothetical protein
MRILASSHHRQLTTAASFRSTPCRQLEAQNVIANLINVHASRAVLIPHIRNRRLVRRSLELGRK